MKLELWYAGVLAGVVLGMAARAAAAEKALEWEDVPRLVAAITVPTFPDRSFAIAERGAVADGRTDSLPALQAAIDACHAAGGGRVEVPAGVFLLNGPVVLKSRVNLHLHEGAILRFSGRPEHFLPAVLVRWEGTLLYNYSPLIYAYRAEAIAITGRGLIDGNARAEFRQWRAKQKPAQERLRQMGAAGTPVAERRFGAGDWLRPSLIQPLECSEVLIEGVRIEDSPFWVIHPTLCRNVTVRGVTVDSTILNNDGCDPDSSENVLIEDCYFRTGDDGIAIKAGRDADAWKVGRGTRNVIIRRCRFDANTNAVCIGSEMSGGVHGVFVEDCDIIRAGTCVYFKSNRDRGGEVGNVRVRNLRIQDSRQAIVGFDTNYHSYRGGNAPSGFHDFVIENLRCEEASGAVLAVVGMKEKPITQVLIRDLEIKRARAPLNFRLEAVDGVKVERVSVLSTVASP